MTGIKVSLACLSILHDDDLGPVHNTTLNNALRCVAFASTLVGTQRDAKIYSDPTYLCVGSLRLIAKKSLKILFLRFAN